MRHYRERSAGQSLQERQPPIALTEDQEQARREIGTATLSKSLAIDSMRSSVVHMQ